MALHEPGQTAFQIMDLPTQLLDPLGRHMGATLAGGGTSMQTAEPTKMLSRASRRHRCSPMVTARPGTTARPSVEGSEGRAREV
ncbi:hypothetical protein ACFVJW_20750 [Streptomyces libani]|uniref:Uncharacterized protein n=1 Tax=Streptomyces nigrescens TaxID=1920 RepID=A0A640T8F9_STRNI|nr:hypothetical protein [Streptomyces libani]MCX5449487.1 hypothetical protein [Streptomyces libani]WAT94506.1 hypothetical protein STRLI_000136 [Streptomyces libani subsp. libani]GFE19598.1 hypothetical protein Sliba_00510 [Streptomyces libani subsp. libani]GGW04572.1 hypothetical protein GCM10010500_66910 [Streptomyces libani subsp. libani]